MAPKMYDVLMGGQCSSLKWYCDACDRKSEAPDDDIKEEEKGGNTGKMDAIISRLDKFLERMESMEHRLGQCELKVRDSVQVESFEQKLEILTNRIQKLEEGQNDKADKGAETSHLIVPNPPHVMKSSSNRLEDDEETDRIIDRDIRELCDRERRKANIVVFNVEESNDEDPQQRKQEDIVKLQDIMKKIDIIASVQNPVRMGPRKESNKYPRPLRVTVDDEKTKWKILKEAKNLKEEGKENQLYIRRDMTVMEREQEAQLRKELREKRLREEAEGGQARWIIWKGKVTKAVTERKN